MCCKADMENIDEQDDIFLCSYAPIFRSLVRFQCFVPFWTQFKHFYWMNSNVTKTSRILWTHHWSHTHRCIIPRIGDLHPSIDILLLNDSSQTCKVISLIKVMKKLESVNRYWTIAIQGQFLIALHPLFRCWQLVSHEGVYLPSVRQ